MSYLLQSITVFSEDCVNSAYTSYIKALQFSAIQDDIQDDEDNEMIISDMHTHDVIEDIYEDSFSEFSGFYKRAVCAIAIALYKKHPCSDITLRDWLDDIDEYIDTDDIGRDFAFTRNGHGVGFWDGDYDIEGVDMGDELTRLAHSYGSLELFYTNGQVHVERC